METTSLTTSKELNHIMIEVENAKSHGKARYLISSKRLKPEYEKALLDAGYKLKKGLIATLISW